MLGAVLLLSMANLFWPVKGEHPRRTNERRRLVAEVHQRLLCSEGESGLAYDLIVPTKKNE
ncbi:hypothetical protein ATY38_07750 [Nitrosomonas ureae]|nr:hypothetical protein ATY38_07750 [Nitrosomonas ureae]